MYNIQGTISNREAANFLGVDIRTLYNWRKEGVGPPYVEVKVTKITRYRYFKGDLVKFKHDNIGV